MLLLLCLLAAAAASKATATPTCRVTNDTALLASSVVLSQAANMVLQFKADADTLTVALSASAQVGYLGFGFPEQGSGAMPGADMVTVTFGSGGVAKAVDRYVPWQAFPYAPYGGSYRVTNTLSIVASPSVFPNRDCDNNGTDDWVVVSALQTNACKQVVLKRKLVTSDPNDRPVPVGQARFLWAYGLNNSVSYHGGARGVGSATFLPDPNLQAPTPCPCLLYTSDAADD